MWVPCPLLQPSASAGSFSSEGGFRGNSEYTRSQLESSAAQKDNFFARKMQVPYCDLQCFALFSHAWLRMRQLHMEAGPRTAASMLLHPTGVSMYLLRYN